MIVLQRAARQVANALGHESAIVRNVRPLYERALATLTGSRGIPWTINGHAFRISPFHRHRMGAVYDPQVASFLERHVAPGSVCFDVGANVGVYALQFANWTGPGGRVVAFEPNPVSAAALRDHVRMNGVESWVDVVPSAVADTPGTRTFHMADADGMSRLEAPNPEIAAKTRAADVAVTTIDRYCDETNTDPDWLLIDIEGFEFSALKGASRTIARLGERLNIVVEMHPDAWAVAGWTRETAAALLDSLGLELEPLSGQCDPLGHYGHVLLRRSRPRPGAA